MTDKLELLRQIGADMQADPERGFENYVTGRHRYYSWHVLVYDAEHEPDVVRRSHIPLITHDQIPWQWLKWDWVVASTSGSIWYNTESEPQPNEKGWKFGYGVVEPILTPIKMPTVPPERWRETKMKRPEGM